MPIYDKSLPIAPDTTGKVRRRPPRPCIGWRYTPDEDYAIERAKRSSKAFMLRYGKGSRPLPVDKSHYCQNEHQDKTAR